MDKPTSSNAANYKRKSSTIDKRNLRVHRRSLDWKQQRSEEVNRRRNCDDMSPVVEETDSAQHSFADRTVADHTDENSTPTKRRAGRIGTPRSQKKPSNKKGFARLHQLKKWQEERLLKKKLESESKKPLFKVGKVNHKDLQTAYPKPANQTQKKTKKAPAAQATAAPPVPKTEPASAVSQRVTRSTVSRIAPQKAVPAPKSKAPAAKTEMVTNQRSARTATQAQSEKQHPAATEVRTTRSRTSKAAVSQAKQPARAAAASKKAPVGKSKVSEQKGDPALKPTEPQTADVFTEPTANTVFNFNAQTVSTRRGVSESSWEFSFTAPANLSSFSFTPLSPSAVAKFLGSSSLIHSPVPRRCSTPKFPGLHSEKEKLSRTPVDKNADDKLKESAHTGAESSDKEVNSGSDGFKSRRSVRRSIRLQHAEKLDVVSEERLGSSVSAETEGAADQGSGSDDEQGKASLPVTPSEGQEINSVASNNAQNHKTNMAEEDSDSGQEISNEERAKNDGKKCDTDWEVVKGEKTVIDQEDVIEQAPAHAVENLKKSAQRVRRSTRRSLRLASAEDTQSLTTSEGKDSSVETQTKDTKEPTVLKSTSPSETDNEDKIDVHENSKALNGSAAPDPTTPVSTSRRNSRIRRSLTETITSPEAQETAVAETTKAEKPTGKETSEDTAVTQITEEETARPEPSTSDLTKDNHKEIEDVFSNVENMVTPKPTTRRLRKSTSCVEEFLYPSPELTAKISAKKSARKKRSMSARRADKKVNRSPEEWIKILEASPMIEMTRRSRKKKSPENRPLPIDFDDIDSLIGAGPATTSEEQDVEFSASDSFIQLQGSNSAKDTAADDIHGNGEEIKANDDKENSAPVTTTDMTSAIKGASHPAADVKSVSDSPQEERKEHDVKYFRDLMDSERCRLNGLCTTWEANNESEAGLSEDVKGQIRTTVGQAQLLMDQRFKQFTGLVDDCEFKTGEKETTCSDLQGFWDMIYFQVDDVDKKFRELEKLKAGNWVKEESVQPTKLKTKKKTVSKPAQKPAGKSKFAAFRAQMKKKNQGGDTSCSSDTLPAVKVFDAGFFKVSSPQKTPPAHCAGGTPSKPQSKPQQVQFAPEETESSPKKEIPRFSLSGPSTPIPPVINRTPRRRSYVPAVPSPLLCDITPSGAKKRRSYRNTPVPVKLLKRHAESTGRSDDEEQDKVVSPVKTRRRSRSSSKNVSHLNPAPEPSTPGESDLSNVQMYTQPLTVLENKQENGFETKPKSAMKKSRRSKSATRKSVRLSVHFDASFKEEEKSGKNMPQTPVNRNSRVAQTRVRSNSFSMPCWDDEETDLFKDSPRASTGKENDPLLMSPFTKDVASLASPKATNKRRSRITVQEDLISFSPGPL
ncbi:titin homolog [Liolophura sinensis]|uniref:titin homolog n=1 Tax=Liolophura sinensis TaxID=3198878 RepID=UPI003157FA6A